MKITISVLIFLTLILLGFWYTANAILSQGNEIALRIIILCGLLIISLILLVGIVKFLPNIIEHEMIEKNNPNKAPNNNNIPVLNLSKTDEFELKLNNVVSEMTNLESSVKELTNEINKIKPQVSSLKLNIEESESIPNDAYTFKLLVEKLTKHQ